MTGRARDRDTIVGTGVAAATVVWTILVATQGAGRWPWVGAVILAAAVFLVLPIPSARAWLREHISGRPARAAFIVGAVAVSGAALTFASGVGPWWDVVLWPLCLGVAAWAIGADDDGEPSNGRLLIAAALIAILAGRFNSRLQIRTPGDLDFSLQWFAGLDVMLFLLLVVRPLRDFDIGLGLRARDLRAALLALVALLVIALPAGYAIGFLRFNDRWNGLGYGAGRLFGLTLFVGLAEEIFFRGIIQRSFTRLWGDRVGWIAASVLFGLTHIVKHAPPLNWRYALLATIAGFAYGWVYRKTGRVAAAAVTHGLVDWTWSTFLLVP